MTGHLEHTVHSYHRASASFSKSSSAHCKFWIDSGVLKVNSNTFASSLITVGEEQSSRISMLNPLLLSTCKYTKYVLICLFIAYLTHPKMKPHVLILFCSSPGPGGIIMQTRKRTKQESKQQTMITKKSNTKLGVVVWGEYSC